MGLQYSFPQWDSAQGEPLVGLQPEAKRQCCSRVTDTCIMYSIDFKQFVHGLLSGASVNTASYFASPCRCYRPLKPWRESLAPLPPPPTVYRTFPLPSPLNLILPEFLIPARQWLCHCSCLPLNLLLRHGTVISTEREGDLELSTVQLCTVHRAFSAWPCSVYPACTNSNCERAFHAREEPPSTCYSLLFGLHL